MGKKEQLSSTDDFHVNQNYITEREITILNI